MKHTFVGLLVMILAVQEIKAQYFNSNPVIEYPYRERKPASHYQSVFSTSTNEVGPNLYTADKVDGIKQLIEEKFGQLKENIGKLDEKMEEKFADLHKALAAIKPKKLTTFQKLGSKYYYIEHTEQVNWFVAAHKCREMGANLAGLQNAEEFSAVSKKLVNDNYWLDINDLGSEGVFRLLSSGQKPEKLDWHRGEPNNDNGEEHCVELKKIRSKYAMNDRQCLTNFNFICEKDKLE